MEVSEKGSGREGSGKTKVVVKPGSLRKCFEKKWWCEEESGESWKFWGVVCCGERVGVVGRVSRGLLIRVLLGERKRDMQAKFLDFKERIGWCLHWGKV